MIKLFTYNLLPPEEFPLQTGLHTVEGYPVKVYQGIFTKNGKKSPDFVQKDDPLWQDLIARPEQTRKIIPFLGKEESGSLRIAELLLRQFHYQLDIVAPIVCRHFPEWAIEWLVRAGIPSENIVRFADFHTQCKEGPQLEAYMRYYARILSAH